MNVLCEHVRYSGGSKRKKKVNMSPSYIYKLNYDGEITFEYEVVNNHACDVCEEERRAFKWLADVGVDFIHLPENVKQQTTFITSHCS